MAKKPVRQFRFTQEADANLIRLAASFGLTRTQVLEMLINREAEGKSPVTVEEVLDRITPKAAPAKASRFQSFPKPGGKK